MPLSAPKLYEINYPPPYSQTWNTAEAPPTSPRLNRRISRINSYSSQNWLDKKNAVSKVKPMRTVSSQPTQPTPYRCPCRRTPSQFRGDPGAPHLKYGLFANPRKPVIIGNLANAITSRPPLKKKATAPDIAVRKVVRERQPMPEEDHEEPEQLPSEDAPTLVFRPLSRRYTHQLSASDVHHLDIKPGRRMNCPRFPRAIVV